MKEVKYMAKEQKKEGNRGLVTLIICGLIAVALMVGCIFFPEELFGLFK